MGVSNKPCPSCREKGRDVTGDHLFLMRDGVTWHCNRCGYTEKDGSVIEYEEEEVNLKDVEDIMTELPSATLHDRKLNKQTLEHYGVKVAFEGSGEVKSHYYPVTKKGEITGYKTRRRFQEDDKEVVEGKAEVGVLKCFRKVGDTKGKVELFGQKATPVGGKKLVITGGELDALSVWQMLTKRYPDYPQAVVSLPTGENTKGVADNLDYVLSFEEVLIYTDMDEVGQKVAAELATLIGPEKARVIKTSEKDASDMLVNGKDKEFINAYWKAKRYTPAGIVEGGIGKEELKKPLEKGVYVDVLPKTMEKMRGLRGGELTLVLAPAGVGKTTITKEVGYALNKSGKKIVHVFLEEDLKKTQQSYIAMDNNVHLARYREDPSLVSDEAFDKSYEELVEGQLYINHWGSMAPNEVMSHFRYGAVWGADFGLLDHVSMVFSGSETTNERKDIDKLLTDMAAFTNESGMHIVVVSHITRKNRPFRKKEDYPYWETVASDAGRGSGAFEQLAHNIITIEVEYLDEDMNKGRIRTRVAKNREWSVLGVGDVLQYDYKTGRITPEPTNTFEGSY